jgi:hypothetical protein
MAISNKSLTNTTTNMTAMDYAITASTCTYAIPACTVATSFFFQIFQNWIFQKLSDPLSLILQLLLFILISA